MIFQIHRLFKKYVQDVLPSISVFTFEVHGFGIFKAYFKIMIYKNQKSSVCMCMHACVRVGMFIHVNALLNMDGVYAETSMYTSIFIPVWLWNTWYNFSEEMLLSV